MTEKGTFDFALIGCCVAVSFLDNFLLSATCGRLKLATRQFFWRTLCMLYSIGRHCIFAVR